MSAKNTTLCAIAAVGPDNVIGLAGKMPWYSRQDFYHFKHTTYGFPCIFGKNTYENMSVKPLPGRVNIVCSSSYNNKHISKYYYHARNIESAIKQCKGYDKAFICGGRAVYKYVLDNDLIDIMYLTVLTDEKLANQIKKNPDLYTRFPQDVSMFFDENKWRCETMLYPGMRKQGPFLPHVKFYRFVRKR